MKHYFLVLFVFILFENSSAQESNKEAFIRCGGLYSIDSSESCKKTISELLELKSISRGDSGEEMDSEKYLLQFKRFVLFFDNNFHDSTLIKIIQNDYCSLVSCYAFNALLLNSDSSLSQEKVIGVILPFAHRTNSYVRLDWGCGQNNVETFDFMLSIATGEIDQSYFPNLYDLSYSSIVYLMDERKEFYNGIDDYGRLKSWEEYSNRYIYP